jgi:hypothetical protein
MKSARNRRRARTEMFVPRARKAGVLLNDARLIGAVQSFRRLPSTTLFQTP